MNLELKNKVAIVGGTSKGVGYCIARILAQEDVTVAITARHEPDLSAAGEEPAEVVQARLREEITLKQIGPSTTLAASSGCWFRPMVSDITGTTSQVDGDLLQAVR